MTPPRRYAARASQSIRYACTRACAAAPSRRNSGSARSRNHSATGPASALRLPCRRAWRTIASTRGRRLRHRAIPGVRRTTALSGGIGRGIIRPRTPSGRVGAPCAPRERGAVPGRGSPADPLMIRLLFRRRIAEGYRRELLRVWTPFLLVGITALVATYLLFVEPPPPRRLTIATGQPTGRYHAFAERYRAYLAGFDIALEIRETAGSAENVALLLDPASGVSVAFVQGGAMPPDARDRLSSLASVYREPLWIFHRGDRPYDRLTDLAGKRLSIGPEGSGTRVVAQRLLADSGVTAAGQAAAGAPFEGLPDRQAAEALQAGRIDAAFFIVGPGSEQVQQLIRADGVRLMTLRQHQSYARRYPYLTSVVLSEGLLDLERNIPPAPSPLLAPPAALVANATLHPALVPLLIEAARAAHEPGNLLDAPGEFPSARFVEAPLRPEARRYLEEGPSLLQRVLPFWPASMVSRLKLMLLPLATVIFSIFKIAQPLYNWRISARIYRHYEILRRAQRELAGPPDPARRAEMIATLRQLEEKLATVSVPLGAMAALYQLYLHLGYVRRRLEGEQPSLPPPPPPPVA
ncbi:Hypothetical protein sce6648 [Sorangium cellulosum So ce56]|uniref:C4-dicarboxylate ABC transporter substrate-binding protein n=2 Tax=Sorangium cellulosum TaxID=56 RepID=A9GPX7_SORC5|nr:Hypothetical protein sce6648 [Sorangium cellulosum So ce56]